VQVGRRYSSCTGFRRFLFGGPSYGPPLSRAAVVAASWGLGAGGHLVQVDPPGAGGAAGQSEGIGHLHLHLFATRVEVTTWTELKTQCGLGGVEVSTAHSLPVDSYPGEILIRAGKTCVIHGNGKTLDAGGGGRIFSASGTGPGSSLQVHNLALIIS
jgi:hypothetical protein